MARLYFRQLRAGVDFGAADPLAARMRNLVYLVGDRDTGEALVVDPAWGVDEIVALAQAEDMKIVGALATHYHPDHVGGQIFGHTIEGLARLIAIAPCRVHAHRLEVEGIAKITGLSKTDLQAHDSGDRVRVGGVEVELLHTPGHTPGSLCFRLGDALVSGDTLFLSGCGRVDLPGGDVDAMFRSLRRLDELPTTTVLYPGHDYGGREADFAALRRTNHYLQITELERWRELFAR